MKPQIPADLPVDIEYKDLIAQLARSNHELGSLSGSLLHPGVHPQLLITPLLTKEAVLSSSIEGTVASVEDVFRYEVDQAALDNEELRRDAHEVINYRRALEASLDELDRRAIGENLLKRAHAILLDSVRGQRKSRGQFRSSQVSIGKPGTTIEEATFVPAPAGEIPRLMKNWEAYINSRAEKDPLVQIAVAHYQFEAIHPFLDGNGRIGRLVIPLFLCDRNLLPSPLLYVSEFFENNRSDYIRALRGVDQDGAWTPWISFYLRAVEVQAHKTQKSILEIMRLYGELSETVNSFGSAYARPMLDAIFVRPIVNYRYLHSELGSSPQTVYNLIDKFEGSGILRQLDDKKRNRMYVFAQLMSLLR
ncbi:MAG: Fic family protein [Anaerolineales bacterium]